MLTNNLFIFKPQLWVILKQPASVGGKNQAGIRRKN